MIKFFRNIRQNLLLENKTGKYFKYAIGEIVLVVIGILIALQINNLNEERKTENKRQVYYKQILQDFESDKDYIKKQTLIIDSNKVKFETYREIFKTPDVPIIEIWKKTFTLDGNYTDVQFNSNTISTLQTTGEITILPASLAQKLISLKKYQEQTEERIRRSNIIAVETINDTRELYGSVDFLMIINNQAEVSDYFEREGENILMQVLLGTEASQDLKRRAENYKLSIFDEILKEMESITTLINNEMNK